MVAVNTASHGRDGTVGRLLPGMRMRLEPVEGIAEGGRLWLSGPNIMLGYMTAERPGELQRLEGEWHDSGDIVSVDREGFLTVRGRAKRFAKIAGEMVSLGAVEILVHSLWPEERHAAVAVPGLLEDLRSRDVGGHQIGSELDPLELQVEDLSDGADEERLGEARRPGDQAVAGGEQADQQLHGHVLLPDDDFRELLVDPIAALADLLDESRVIPSPGSFQLEVALPLSSVERHLGECARDAR